MRWEAHSSFSWNDPSWSRVAWLLTFFFPSFSASTHPLFFCSAPTSHLTSYFSPLFSIELFLLTTLPNSSSSLPFVQFFNHLQTSTNAGQRRHCPAHHPLYLLFSFSTISKPLPTPVNDGQTRYSEVNVLQCLKNPLLLMGLEPQTKRFEVQTTCHPGTLTLIVYYALKIYILKLII